MINEAHRSMNPQRGQNTRSLPRMITSIYDFIYILELERTCTNDFAASSEVCKASQDCARIVHIVVQPSLNVFNIE